MLSFTKNRDQPQNRQVCLTTPKIIDFASGECQDVLELFAENLTVDIMKRPSLNFTMVY